MAAAFRIAGPRPLVLAAAQTQQAAPQGAPPPPPARPAFDIRPSQLREELQRAAWLRAEAYYEERSVGRFKASFVKQFAGQELYSLLRRTQGAQPECITLVAGPAPPQGAGTSGSSSSSGRSGSETGPGSCVGTLDVRLLDAGNPYPSSSWPDGVPAEEPVLAAAGAGGAVAGGAAGTARRPMRAAYVSNVVVAPAQRGRGLGRQLVAEGLAVARERWAVGSVYCHVELDNEAALALYRGAGFVQLGDELPPAEEGLARRLLLCRPLADARV